MSDWLLMALFLLIGPITSCVLYIKRSKWLDLAIIVSLVGEFFIGVRLLLFYLNLLVWAWGIVMQSLVAVCIVGIALAVWYWIKTGSSK